MLRRVHMPELRAGTVALPESEAHHLRDVLRLGVGGEIELFDDTGRTATATITNVSPTGVSVRVSAIREHHAVTSFAIAAALPKGERADWMIEKLSELGISRFIPLLSERSIVRPAGHNKFERWKRISTEAAKQSRRVGVMTIDALTPLAALVSSLPSRALFLSPAADAPPLLPLLANAADALLIIGPEGGVLTRGD